MRNTDKIISAILYLSYVVVFLLSLLVFGVSLFTTVVFRQYEENDLFDFTAENVPLLILSLLLVFALMLAAEAFAQRRAKGALAEGSEGKGVLRAPFPVAMLLVAGGISLFLVLTIRGLPTSDAAQLDEIVGQFMEGNYSALESGAYLDVYPFQITYVYIGEILAHVFGRSNYLVYQILNVIAIEIFLYCLYRIVWELFESRRICLVMQILACGAFCLFVFATFIYQDLWSFAFQTAALYLQILYMKRDRIRYEIGAGILAAVSYLLKSNTLIALIAMVLLLLARAIRKRSGRQILTAIGFSILLAAMTFGASAAVNAYTVARTGIDEMPQGMPAIAYIAMGMQTAEGKCGWYNGFTTSAYRESDSNVEATKELAWQAIEESIGEFSNSGRYCLNFYYQKFISQWGDSTCVSMREMENTSRHTGELSGLQTSLIFGTGSRILQWVMNVCHSMIYLGMVIYTGCVVLGRRKRNPVPKGAEEASSGDAAGGGPVSFAAKENPRLLSLEEALILIFIFGGMLFHELWEASGRYTMRYYLTMLPLAACGISQCMTWIDARVKGICNRVRSGGT